MSSNRGTLQALNRTVKNSREYCFIINTIRYFVFSCASQLYLLQRYAFVLKVPREMGNFYVTKCNDFGQVLDPELFVNRSFHYIKSAMKHNNFIEIASSLVNIIVLFNMSYELKRLVRSDFNWHAQNLIS